MADTASALVFSDGDDFTAEKLNAAFSNLDLRTRGIESLTLSYQQAIDTLNQFGLQRLNDALQPVYDSLIKLANLGAVFGATSTTTNVIGLGLMSFVVKDEDKNRFAAAAYLTAIDATGANSVSGTLQSYDRKTGTLTLMVQTFTGTAGTSISSWTISPGSDFAGAKSYTDNAIASLVGTADANGNTLGELQSMIQANAAQIINAYASAQANAAAAQAAATANALALAIALG